MRNDRNLDKRRRASSSERDGSTMLPLPHVVLDSEGWLRASPISRALLVDIAGLLWRRGGGGLPNGALLATDERLRPRGWRSRSVLRRAIGDLIACGLLAETRKGGMHWPTLYGVTWHALQASAKFELDSGVRQSWDRAYRGTYLAPEKPAPTPQHARTHRATEARRERATRTPAPLDGASSRPSDDRKEAGIGPLDGQQSHGIGPSDGTTNAGYVASSRPLDGHSLEVHHLQGPSTPAAVLHPKRRADAPVGGQS